LPLGVILTLKATTDSPLFDPDIWKRFFTGKWLQKKPE